MQAVAIARCSTLWNTLQSVAIARCYTLWNALRFVPIASCYTLWNTLQSVAIAPCYTLWNTAVCDYCTMLHPVEHSAVCNYCTLLHPAECSAICRPIACFYTLWNTLQSVTIAHCCTFLSKSVSTGHFLTLESIMYQAWFLWTCLAITGPRLLGYLPVHSMLNHECLW